MTRRLTIPKFKSLSQGMPPDEVLEKVFKKYKGTIHDTAYWKKEIKRHINHYVENQKSVKKSKRRSKKSVKKSKRSVKKSRKRT